MYKIVKTFAYPKAIEVEEFYFDSTRPGRGYGDEFTGVSRLHTIPVPAWGDSKVMEDQALTMFLIQNHHTPVVGFYLNDDDYRRLDEINYSA